MDMKGLKNKFDKLYNDNAKRRELLKDRELEADIIYEQYNIERCKIGISFYTKILRSVEKFDKAWGTHYKFLEAIELEIKRCEDESTASKNTIKSREELLRKRKSNR